ncbi:MAG: hypothetical protein LQ350_005125 [Teloschistes chrysophthalmus]|nr:MAG: hypothetical protein LQ350_005125 [Niorma chrysophthalma]
MGNSMGAEADLPVAAGATALLDAVHKYGKEENGKFYNIRVPGWEHNEDIRESSPQVDPGFATTPRPVNLAGDILMECLLLALKQ